MNGFIGGTFETSMQESTGYRMYLKESDFVVPGPSTTWVFVDEHPDSINDGLLAMNMPQYRQWPGPASWADTPASYHNGACGFGFADGHAEMHKWLDGNTIVPIYKKTMAANNGLTSRNDSTWLTARTSAPN